MEDLLKFSHSLELSRDTRKIILEMVCSIKSLFPENPIIAVRDKVLDHEAVIDQASELLKIARGRQEIFEGIFNPDDLEKYLKAASDFGELCGQVEKLQGTLREYQEIAYWLAYRLSSMIIEHLEMTCPDDIEHLNRKLSGISKPVRRIYPGSRGNLRVV